MFKRIISLWMLLMLLLTCMPVAQAASAPEVLTQPESQTVVEGSSCTFTAKAKGHTGITWRLRSPDGREDFPLTDAAEHFPGLRVSGKNSNNLKLKNIPGKMDGWLVYCVYSTKSRKTETDAAILHVTDRSGNPINGESTPDEPESGNKAAYVSAASERTLQTYGCTAQFVNSKGTTKGDSFTFFDFTDSYRNTATGKTVTDGTLDVRVAADIPRGESIDYWVINGVRYDFNRMVKSFTLRELTYPMTIEVVLKGNDSLTLLSEEEIQAKRTGDDLIVTSRNAKMYHLDGNDGKGSSFREFDFTQDYRNLATGDQETGGRVNLRVLASIPDGKSISYWKFNDARLNFNADIVSFLAKGLSDSMTYEPVFYTSATPVPEYTVKCKNCTFSGGGYTNAKSGTVPYGTKITITPQGSSYLGWWSGSYSTDEVTKKAITRTVKSNCSFEWHDIIN